jgi:hypothetical protein
VGLGDFVFSWDYDLFADGSKARRFGFHEYVDPEQMFLKIFQDFKDERIIPWAGDLYLLRAQEYARHSSQRP